jgi:hypothetical protein
MAMLVQPNQLVPAPCVCVCVCVRLFWLQILGGRSIGFPLIVNSTIVQLSIHGTHMVTTLNCEHYPTTIPIYLLFAMDFGLNLKT